MLVRLHSWEEEPFYTLLGMQTSTITMEICIEIPQKARNRNSFDPAILLLGVLQKELTI